jgi:Fe-S cluster biogenesis protein NfuA
MGVLNRGRGRTDSAVEGRIREAIDGLRALLRSEAFVIELVEFREGVALIRVAGDCPDCEAHAGVFMQGIEAHLRDRVPEIRSVRAIGPDPEQHG